MLCSGAASPQPAEVVAETVGIVRSLLEYGRESGFGSVAEDIFLLARKLLESECVVFASRRTSQFLALFHPFGFCGLEVQFRGNGGSV